MDAGGAYAITRLTDDADLDDVVALEKASFSHPWTREMLARELRNADVSRVYVMRDAPGVLLGFCASWFLADELHINTLAIRQEQRRRGHATRLLRFVFRQAAGEGVTRATLEVRRSNTAALRLYERLGFGVRGIRPKYYVQPEEDALILWSEQLAMSD